MRRGGGQCETPDVVGEGEGGQGERFFCAQGRIVIMIMAGFERGGVGWYRPSLSMWAARASRSIGGPSSSVVGRNCRCLCA